VTAAPVYHSHPHIPAEFSHVLTILDNKPSCPGKFALSPGSGWDLTDIVQLFRFMVDQEKNQDAINRVVARYFGDHRPTTTSVEVVRLATDPRLVLELTAVAVVAE
jgi:2-iminobutanoate/2-iminopropanoate deaminase